MARADDAENLWGAVASHPARGSPATARSLGAALLAIAQPDLFGHVGDVDAADRLAALRRRRCRARLRTAARELLAEPWAIEATGASPGAVLLARRFLRRYPERDRADPAPPLLTARQEAATWHAEEAMAEECYRRDTW